MPQIISIINQKGGVGKSTVSVNLSHALVLLGKRVLLIDMDPQHNSSDVLLGNESEEFNANIYRVLKGRIPLNTAIVSTRINNLDVIPGTIELADAELEFSSVFGREKLLKNGISGVKYDYVIIDCPPNIGLPTINALYASNGFIIPFSPSHYALKGYTSLRNLVENVRNLLGNKRLSLLGALLTMADHTNVSKRTVGMVTDYFRDRVFSQRIRRTVRVEEANSRQMTMLEYLPKSDSAQEFLSLAREVVNRGNRKG